MSTGEQVELNRIKKCKENPIMNTIYKDPFERHRKSAENMHKSRLILPFSIMNQSHDQSPTLNLSVLLRVTHKIK